MISVVVTSDGSGDVDTATDRVTRAAAELALIALRDVWPVQTGASRDGLRSTVDSVEGTASYTTDVRLSGTRVPIAYGLAHTIAQVALDDAIAAADITDALDGAVSSILRSNLER